MITLREVRENYLEKIYYIPPLNAGESVAENDICMVSNQLHTCSCRYEDPILNVDIHQNVWLLPYKNSQCYGIRIPKKLKEKDEGYLLTPSLTGCSIHIIDEGGNWLIIHDARGDCGKEVDTKSKRTHNLWFSTENCVSYEWSELGYRFVKGGIDLEKLGTNVDMSDSEVKSMAANVMFYYDSTEGWIILTHKTYGVESIGGSEKPLSAFFEERER